MTELRKTEIAFTVKARCRDNCVEWYYEALFNIWDVCHKCVIVTKCPETDKLGRLHYHGILSVPKGKRWTDLMNNRFTVYFKQLYDRYEWEQYCFKNVDMIRNDPEHPSFKMPTYPLWKKEPIRPKYLYSFDGLSISKIFQLF